MDRQAGTVSTLAPLLRSRVLRVLLIASPGLMVAVGVLTTMESNLALAVVLNAAAGVIVSSCLFIAVSMVAGQVADHRISLVRAADDGQFRARARLLSIRHEEAGLYADWYFRLRLQEELDRSSRYGQSFAVLVGHPVGARSEADARSTSGLLFDSLRRHLRSSDLPALLKDGSLAILLPHTAKDAALRRRVTKALNAPEMRSGLACYPDDGLDPETLLSVATTTAAIEEGPAAVVRPQARKASA